MTPPSTKLRGGGKAAPKISAGREAEETYEHGDRIILPPLVQAWQSRAVRRRRRSSTLTEQGIWHIAIGRYVGTLVEAIDKWVDIAMRENNVNGVIDSFESLTEAGDEIRRAIKANGERLTGLEEALVNLNNAQKAVEAERRAVDESRGA